MPLIFSDGYAIHRGINFIQKKAIKKQYTYSKSLIPNKHLYCLHIILLRALLNYLLVSGCIIWPSVCKCKVLGRVGARPMESNAKLLCALLYQHHSLMRRVQVCKLYLTEMQARISCTLDNRKHRFPRRKKPVLDFFGLPYSFVRRSL